MTRTNPFVALDDFVLDRILVAKSDATRRFRFVCRESV